MLHIESSDIRNCLLQGKFGLEKEGLRVYENAAMAHTPHPFADDNHITRDFSENQTEINTCAEPSAEGAVLALQAYDRQIRRKISSLERPEYIWPFSFGGGRCPDRAVPGRSGVEDPVSGISFRPIWTV